MRRVLGIAGLVSLAVGLALGTAGTVAGQEGQTGYDDAEVLGAEERLPEGAVLVEVDLTEGEGTFDEALPPGVFVDVTASGFGPETKGTVEINSERRTLAFVTADTEGVIRQRVQIPEDMPLGDHTLQVIGVDPDGKPRTVSMKIEVAEGGGESSNWPAWTAGSIAVALALAGLMRWQAGRRRERTAIPS